MSFDLLGATFTASPTEGAPRTRVTFTDASFAYDYITETGSAPDTIEETGSATDTISEGS